MREAIAGALLGLVVLFIIFLGVTAVSNPDHWITPEQIKCEEMGGLFIQNSFSKDCIFNPNSHAQHK